MRRHVDISHPDKMLFTEIGWTKQSVVDFYSDLADFLLPHLKNRPVVAQCFPDGVDEKGYYQQEAPSHYPEWIKTIDVKRKEKSPQKMLEIHTRSALKFVVNQNGISFHTWKSRQDHLNNPDLLIYDLDPSGSDFSKVVRAAKKLKGFIEELGGTPYVMTTGSKGLHIVVPIQPKNSYKEVRQTAKEIAQEFIERHPDLATIEMRKEDRKGRIFLDYLRNSYGQTTVSPYSLRPLAHAPVATPLAWDELTSKLTPQTYHGRNIFRRLAQKEDPWGSLYRSRCSLKRIQI